MPGPMGMMRPAGKREKGDLKSFKKLLVYCKRYLPAIIVALLLAVGGSVTSIIGPEKLSDLTNTLTAGILIGVDMDAVFEICTSSSRYTPRARS